MLAVVGPLDGVAQDVPDRVPRQPDLPRGFKVPLYPLVPIASIGGCIWIIWDLRTVTITVFCIWSSVALLWYFFYGRHHSALNRPEETP